MSERKKFLVVDDVPLFRRSYAVTLEIAGHLALQAGSVEDALAIILAETMLNGILLDGNLTPDSEDGLDGKIVADAFRAKFPGKPVISISSTHGLPWADRKDISGNSSIENIIEAVTGVRPE